MRNQILRVLSYLLAVSTVMLDGAPVPGLVLETKSGVPTVFAQESQTARLKKELEESLRQVSELKTRLEKMAQEISSVQQRLRSAIQQIEGSGLGKSPASVWKRPAEPGTYEVIRNTSVFEEPSPSSRKVSAIQQGTKVSVVGSVGDWLEVRSKYGKPPGFIRRDDAMFTEKKD